jgi:hypothetical protein
VIVAIACPSPTLAQLRVERRVVGDTTVVRTIGTEPASATRRIEKVFSFGKLDGPPELVFGATGGVRLGVDGSVWVFDRTIPLLRQYDSTGRYIRAVGRGGQGPGEYENLLGVAFGPGRTVYLLNPIANRVSVYSAAGAHVTDWRIPPDDPRALTPVLASAKLIVDTAGTIYVATSVTLIPPVPPSQRWRSIPGVARYRPNGTARDTLKVPSLGLEPAPMLWAGSRGLGLDYMPHESWLFTRFGNFVGGRSDRYAIHVVAGTGKVTRVERDIPRVPISQAERDAMRERITRTFRQQDPLWTWNGPEAPREKPFFDGITTDEDGRIWVELHVPSERLPDAERAAAASGTRGRGGAPVTTDLPSFREPKVFEVFSPDARYLGRVQLPDFNYWPAIKGNAVWMGTVDADGAPVVTKFRIEPGLPR